MEVKSTPSLLCAGDTIYLSVVSCSCRVVSCSSEKEQCQDNSGPHLGDVTLGYLRVLLFTIRLVRPRGLRERL